MTIWTVLGEHHLVFQFNTLDFLDLLVEFATDGSVPNGQLGATFEFSLQTVQTPEPGSLAL